MRGSMKDYMREALITVALFGGIGVGFAQSPASSNEQSAESPKVPGHNGIEEPSAKQPSSQSHGPGIFVNGTLDVPNAPHDVSTTPAKFSSQNDKLDHLPTMARGPALTDEQRKLILDRVKETPGAGAAAHLATGLATELPATIDLQTWPPDVVRDVPSIRDTKYLALPDKILVVQPDNAIVVGEIDR
jgi:hypothetical protein